MVRRVVAIPRASGGTSPPTGPTDDNPLLPVADLFDDDDNPHQPDTNPLDVNQPDVSPLDTVNQPDANSLDTILRAINKRFDDIIAKLDDNIDKAIIGKIDDVVTEVTDRALPIIVDQVNIQVSTTIDSHLSELRQKHTELQQQVTDIDSRRRTLHAIRPTG